MKLQKNKNDRGTDKKKAPTAASTLKPQIYEEECPVCLDTLPVDVRTLSRMICCGKAMHTSCYEDIMKSTMNDEQKNACPLCRTRYPGTDKDELKQLRKWAEKGATWAENMLANKYYFGKLGLTQSYDKAIQLYEMAIAQGDPHAMFQLGTMYSLGEGVDQSYKRAAELYTMAADLGHAGAQCNLGASYYNGGQRVEQSYESAREWWTKAAAQGDADAIENLKMLDEMEGKNRRMLHNF